MKLSAESILNSKNKNPLTMLTCYDAMTASLLEECGVDILLVGDSCANVFLGAESTRAISVDRLAYHVEAVRNGAPETHILADLDYNSSQNPETAAAGARLLMQAGADSIKVEGYDQDVFEALTAAGIPLCGHVGLLPQTAESFRVHGRENEEAENVIKEAARIESAGAFMMVAECIPSELGRSLHQTLSIPLIGIGAGSDVDGQVLVINDLLGMTEKTAKFVRRYSDLRNEVKKAVTAYIRDVNEGAFPDETESYR